MMPQSGPESDRAVLVIDDDDVFRNRLCRALEERGWSASGAGNGVAALEIAARIGPDLAVVDLRLPGMGGLEIVSALRDLEESICIVVLTGYGSIATALTATKLGANHFLSKPADADQILTAYERIVAGSDEALSAGEEQSVPSLARVEWEHVQRVLTDCSGNVSQAAKLLGLHRRSLQRKLTKYPPRV
jgi:two-component system response regulator RegA